MGSVHNLIVANLVCNQGHELYATIVGSKPDLLSTDVLTHILNEVTVRRVDDGKKVGR